MTLDKVDSPSMADTAGRDESTEERREDVETNITLAKNPPEVPGLPRLNYNLWDHKRRLFTVTTLLVIEASLLPVGLYYGLWYGTNLSHGVLFAIVTAFFGFVTGVEFARRSWRLARPADTYRPIGGGRWCFDYTHHTLSFGYTYMTGVLIGGSIPTEPIVRVLSMPVPLLLLQLGTQLLVSSVMYACGTRAPFAISSIRPGEPVLPAVFTFVEDVVAVDGGAGKPYRILLRERFNASAIFRGMIVQLSWLWGIGGFIVGAGTLIAIWTIPNEEVAYGVGWLTPLAFVALWVCITVNWCQRSLRIEKERWADMDKPVQGANLPEKIENGDPGSSAVVV